MVRGVQDRIGLVILIAVYVSEVIKHAVLLEGFLRGVKETNVRTRNGDFLIAPLLFMNLHL